MHSNRQNKWVRAPESWHPIPPKIRAAFPLLWECGGSATAFEPAQIQRSSYAPSDQRSSPLPRRAPRKTFAGTVIPSPARDLLFTMGNARSLAKSIVPRQNRLGRTWQPTAHAPTQGGVSTAAHVRFRQGTVSTVPTTSARSAHRSAAFSPSLPRFAGPSPISNFNFAPRHAVYFFLPPPKNDAMDLVFFPTIPPTSAVIFGSSGVPVTRSGTPDLLPLDPFNADSSPTPTFPIPLTAEPVIARLKSSWSAADTVPLPLSSPMAGITASILVTVTPAFVMRTSARNFSNSVVSLDFTPPSAAIPWTFVLMSNPTRRVLSSAIAPLIVSARACPAIAKFKESVPPFSLEPFGSRIPAAVISGCSSSIGKFCPASFRFSKGSSIAAALFAPLAAPFPRAVALFSAAPVLASTPTGAVFPTAFSSG